MNANLYEGRADAQDVVDAVREYHVDILVLEEITPGLLEEMDGLGLADLLPERVGQPDYMVAGTMILANQPLTDHVVMRNLDDAGFRDAGEVANEGWQPTWPANHVSILPLLPPLVRIDHVLVGRALTSLGTETVDIDGTDHLAVIATVARRA